jgi:hypothetical protein
MRKLRRRARTMSEADLRNHIEGGAPGRSRRGDRSAEEELAEMKDAPPDLLILKMIIKYNRP